MQADKFRRISALDNVVLDDLKKSIHLNLNKHQIDEAGEGAGKSGNFFFFTFDNKYLIKTMTDGDVENLLEILDKYIAHLEENPDSLLARYYGMFRVKTPFFSPQYFVLMKNVSQFQDPSKELYKFDLKGSTYSRGTEGFSPVRAIHFSQDLQSFII